jgi:cytochrome P450
MSDRRLPPGPPGRLLSGHLHRLRRDRLDFYVECVRTYGDVAALRFAWHRVWLVSHPDLVEAVLVTHARDFGKHFILRLNPEVFGQGLLTSDGDFWLRQRRLIQPAFSRQRLAGFAPEVVAAAGRLLTRWAPGRRVDVEAEMMRLTMDIAARVFFGADASADADAVAEAVGELQEMFLIQFTRPRPWPRWLPTPLHRRIDRAVARLDAIIYRYIEQGRAAKEQRNNLLSLLLHARDEGDGKGMTDRQVRDEAMTLFLAGHETTALTLSWAWYLLAGHPEVEARLMGEWRQVLAGRDPAVEDLPRLRYTEMVVHEALRLYPPAAAFGREALREVALGGYRVPRGLTVIMSPWVLQRDPRWWDEPEVFRPERWAAGHPARTPKYAYVPFGGGPRLCIGAGFAMMEAVLILATLGQRYRFTTDPGYRAEPLPSFTLRLRHGLPTTLQARE